MHQKQVASILHIDRSAYQYYEAPEREYCSLKILNKLASIFKIPVTQLMDDYHLFLYNAPGNTIRQFRKSLGFTQNELADRLHVCRKTVRDWEKENTRISKSTYLDLFVNRILG